VFPVLKNSPVHSIADLKGKMVATTNAQSRHTADCRCIKRSPSPHSRSIGPMRAREQIRRERSQSGKDI
jgi:hypothetical protein